jgi:hypothetical protein
MTPWRSGCRPAETVGDKTTKNETTIAGTTMILPLRFRAWISPAIAPVAIALAASALAGCAMQPVQPWEKGDLAKPSMTFSTDPLEERFNQHIYSSKENASGGYGVGGGGCGCN